FMLGSCYRQHTRGTGPWREFFPPELLGLILVGEIQPPECFRGLRPFHGMLSAGYVNDISHTGGAHKSEWLGQRGQGINFHRLAAGLPLEAKHPVRNRLSIGAADKDKSVIALHRCP